MPRATRIVGRIAAKEFREVARSGQLRWAAAIVLALLATSLVVGWQAQQRVNAERAAASEVARSQWDRQPPKNPHAAAHYGMYVFKPRPLLSYFDDGITRWVGVSAYLVAHIQKPLDDAAAQDATTALRFGTLTPARVLQLLLPLLIILVAAPLFAGERERGTLRQLLSLGIHPPILLAGKALGAGLVLLALLVPVAAVSVGFASLGATDSDLGSAATRIGLVSLAYAAYAAVWLFLSLAVSALARTGRDALVLLMGFWLIATIIAPRVGADLAKHAFRPQLAGEITARIQSRLGALAYDPTSAPAAAGTVGGAEAAVEGPEGRPISIVGVELQRGEDAAAALIDEGYGQLWNAFDRQGDVVRAFGLAGPFISMRALSQALAGTDLAHHRHFVDAAEAYRREMVRVMNDDIIENAAVVGYAQYRADPDLWNRIPPFEYAPPPLGEVLQRAMPDVLILLAWLLASALAAFFAVRRLSPVD